MTNRTLTMFMTALSLGVGVAPVAAQDGNDSSTVYSQEG